MNTGHQVGWSIVIALAGLWVPALVNLSGLRGTPVTQVVFTVLKIVPLLFMATVGVVFVRSANFGAFNAGGTSVWGAVSATAAIALFSYIGIETASVAAGRVRDPERNVGRATVLGSVTVFGTVPNAEPRDSKAPFTDAANAIFGGQWAGQTVAVAAVAAVVSGIGCLIGWSQTNSRQRR